MSSFHILNPSNDKVFTVPLPKWKDRGVVLKTFDELPRRDKVEIAERYGLLTGVELRTLREGLAPGGFAELGGERT
jgi:hypothetical protein